MSLPAPADMPEVPAGTTPRKPRWRRALRVTSIIAASTAALLIASALTNVGVTAAERANLAPYGQKVTLETGDVNVYRSGGTGPTMVMFSGYGTAAPAVDFAPLIRELDGFDVIVIEGYGYGYSDTDVPGRSVENVTAEVHEVLGRLGVQSPVILLGHSVGGLYTHYYANAYPGEVSAIIGIDPMAATAGSPAVGTPSSLDATITSLGLMRLVSSLAPGIVQPPGTAYTPDERERIAAMTNWNYGNASLADEWSRIGANSAKASELPLPANIPVLEMLASESVDLIPGWLESHTAELDAVSAHQLSIIDGGHYLHWTQSPLLARTITDFLSTHVTP